MGRGRTTKYLKSKDGYITDGIHTCKYCDKIFNGSIQKIKGIIDLHYKKEHNDINAINEHLHKDDYNTYVNMLNGYTVRNTSTF